MKTYFWDKRPNFGDALNAWMWPKLFPKPLEKCFDDETLFVAIGSGLDNAVPQEPKKVVFGTGFAYGTVPTLDERWRIFCVRGPLTAKSVGLDENLAVCDGAVLLREFYEPTTTKTHNLSFMPHFRTANSEPLWEKVCQAFNIHYIHPENSIESVLTSIRESSLIITESLHGAIVADAFRVPWIPVKTRPYINDFKWRDWCSSLSLEHEFETLSSVGVVGGPLAPIQEKVLPWKALLKCGTRLQWLARFGKQRLSQDQVFDSVYARLQERLNEMLNEA